MGSKNLQQILKELGSECVDWNNFAQDTETITIFELVMNLQIPKYVSEFLSSWRNFSFENRTVQHGVLEYWW
jgi:hypothetical protein